jgi:hypothetical protein
VWCSPGDGVHAGKVKVIAYFLPTTVDVTSMLHATHMIFIGYMCYSKACAFHLVHSGYQIVQRISMRH